MARIGDNSLPRVASLLPRSNSHLSYGDIRLRSPGAGAGNKSRENLYRASSRSSCHHGSPGLINHACGMADNFYSAKQYFEPPVGNIYERSTKGAIDNLSRHEVEGFAGIITAATLSRILASFEQTSISSRKV
ncbi:hypothetical protein KM043_006828 [Ampulex compressa]|nr:hypothetical protein KM043_006828 [Ampulex compressa]